MAQQSIDTIDKVRRRRNPYTLREVYDIRSLRTVGGMKLSCKSRQLGLIELDDAVADPEAETLRRKPRNARSTHPRQRLANPEANADDPIAQAVVRENRRDRIHGIN